MTSKKIKEVEEYAKSDVRWWFKNKAEYKDSYPTIQTYIAEKLTHNPEQIERFKKQFGYTDESLTERDSVYNEAFWRSFNWWQKKDLENEKVFAKYKPIFNEAEKLAEKVDVSDIVDGFPCGMAVLYLKPEAKNTDLGKMLRSRSDCDSYSAKACYWSAYKLPIKLPSYGQCMSFDERVCEKVAEFLDSKGIPTGVYSMID